MKFACPDCGQLLMLAGSCSGSWWSFDLRKIMQVPDLKNAQWDIPPKRCPPPPGGHEESRRGGEVLGLCWSCWGWGVAVCRAYPFCAAGAGGVDTLVIEGWLGDYLLEQAAGLAASNGVKRIVLTGGPIETGSYLVEWKTLPEMTKARLEALGHGERFELRAVPAQPVRRGRTRESARALQAEWKLERGAFNLASEGLHARRSGRAFRDEFGDGVEVGSVALTPVAYDGSDWWSCSEGVRAMIGEAVRTCTTVLKGFLLDRGGRDVALSAHFATRTMQTAKPS